MKKILLALTVFFVGATALQAQKPEVVIKDKEGWQKIGTAKVNFKTDKDAFVIMGADKFKALQIRVKDANIHLDDVNVEFDGGEKQDVSLKSSFKAGEKSKVIDLVNAPRGLKKVGFVYRTVPNTSDDRAEIELWGLK